jgi:DNA replication protein DnaC
MPVVQELLIAKRDLKTEQTDQKYSRYESMIIDDLGYIRQTREEMEVIFTLPAERCERGGVLFDQQPFRRVNGPFSKIGRSLQRSDEDGSRHRSVGPSQHHRRPQYSKLPAGTG